MSLRRYSRSRLSWCARRRRELPPLQLEDEDALQREKDACVLTVLMLLLCSPSCTLADRGWGLVDLNAKEKKRGRSCDSATG